MKVALDASRQSKRERTLRRSSASFQALLRKKAGVLAEVRSREFYEKPTSERKRKAAAAVKRHAKKVQREQRRAVRLY
nr:hypothetical protein GCM10020185_41240 [Pseudomonas brassicacearum subsp. brassicacearum]